MDLKFFPCIFALVVTASAIDLGIVNTKESIKINLRKEVLDTEFSNLVDDLFNKTRVKILMNSIEKKSPEDAYFKLVAYDITDDAANLQFKIQRKELEQALKRFSEQIFTAAATSPFVTNQVKSPDTEALEQVTLAIDRIDVETIFKLIVAQLYEPESLFDIILSNPKLVAAMAKYPQAQQGIRLGVTL